MGNFSQLNDDDAELLTGGVVNPSEAYNGSTNYGQSNGLEPNNGGTNPSTFYGGQNYGQAKK